MATPILAPKLFIPAPRSQAVPRPRLIGRLHDGRRAGHKLTLISAPAGFGKTTLLSQWVADIRQSEPKVRVAWLSLDEGDNDPSRFLSYLVAALQTVEPGIAADALTVPAGRPESTESTLTTLINEITAAPHEIILVFDDFHRSELAPIRGALAFLLENCPSNLRVVMASRSDPPLPLARMRARGELTELRAADLRFTPEEAAAFLNRVMGLGLSAADIAALETRTEGWIAGLQLAALSMREHADTAGFIHAFTGSHRFVIDYLVEEVLQSQPESVRRFLLHTAVLDRLNGPLSEAVTGQRAGGQMLRALERDNLFVVPLDDRREWYRYHHLFAEVLRAHLVKEEPDRLPAIHRLASEWYERNDLPEDAISNALAASDFERAAGLIEQAMPGMRRGRQDGTLLGWLGLLPEETIRRRPVLSVFFAVSLLVSGDLDAVEPRLRDAEQGLAAALTDGAGEELRMLPVTIAVYRASLAQARGDASATARHAQHALELTQPGDHLGRGAAAGFLAMASWANGDLEAGLLAFAQVRSSLQAAGNTTDMLGTTLPIADMLVGQGRLREARRAYDQAIVRASEAGDPAGPPLGDLLVGISELHREYNELGYAADQLLASRALGERASLPESRYRWFVAMARIRQAEGEHDAALELLEEGERRYLRGFFPDVSPVAAMRARIWVVQGRFVEAEEWADEKGLTRADELSYQREFEHITLARLLIGQRKVDEALSLLDRLREAADAGRRTGSVNEILVLQALAHAARGDLPHAVACVKRALLQAEAEGYVRLFVDEGAPMAALLREAVRQRIAPDYGRRLLAAIGDADGERPAAGPTAERLSERELQVLTLLQTQLSGPEIARELFVSLNTLRTHTRHIFGKLAVNSRPAAVRRAEEQGLL